MAHLGDVQAASLDAHVRHVLPHRRALDEPDRGIRLVHVPDREVQREVKQRSRRFFVHLHVRCDRGMAEEGGGSRMETPPGLREGCFGVTPTILGAYFLLLLPIFALYGPKAEP